MRKYWKLVGAVLAVAGLAGVLVGAAPNAPKFKDKGSVIGGETGTNLLTDVDSYVGMFRIGVNDIATKAKSQRT